MTEIEERRREQTRRTLITEIFMFCVIVLLVMVLALVAMGYQLNFEKGLEHSGLVQINSIPAGASITVDGEGVFLPTNQSRTMASGPHEISLHRDGYTGWRKTITVTEGMMYRLSYPRLYKENRETVPISLALEDETISPTPSQAFIAPDHKTMILTFAGSSTWRYLDLNDDTPRIRTVSVSGLIEGDIEIIAWSDNNNRILVRSATASGEEWLLLNLRKPAESINLTKEFDLDFSDIRLETGDKLLALTKGNLREINISSREISKVLLSGVENFTNLGSAIAYVGRPSPTTSTVSDSMPTRAVFLYNVADSALSLALPLEDDVPVLLSLSEYYGDFYLACAIAEQLYVYSGSLPSPTDDFSAKMSPRSHTSLEFTPTLISRHGDGELIVASRDSNLAVFDAESYTVSTFTTASVPIWLTEYDFYTITDNRLTAYDFDHTNPRTLVSASAKLPATISENDHYLYYFDTKNALQREVIR